MTLRVVDVPDGYKLVYADVHPDRTITALACRTCGALVADTKVHDAWHDHLPKKRTTRADTKGNE